LSCHFHVRGLRIISTRLAGRKPAWQTALKRELLGQMKERLGAERQETVEAHAEGNVAKN
jgi:hypothetical protein